jgi:hypothetical protein
MEENPDLELLVHSSISHASYEFATKDENIEK